MINLINGDITKLKVDAIVNAANPTLLGGGGVDGAIHDAAGEELMLECIALPEINGVRCKTGEARITSAGRLDAKFVIHTVGPVYRSSFYPAQDLYECYANSIQLALDNGCKSIAFPAISTGVYGYPEEEAKSVALSACKPFENDIDIYLVSFKPASF